MTELELFELYLDYDPVAGTLRWKMSREQHPQESLRACKRWHTLHAGREAGVTRMANGKTPTRAVAIRRKSYQAHAVAYALHHRVSTEGREVWPANGNFLDLRIENLSCTHLNGSPARPVSDSSGERFVFFQPSLDRWQVQISREYVGRFKTKREAIAARDAYLSEHNLQQPIQRRRKVNYDGYSNGTAQRASINIFSRLSNTAHGLLELARNSHLQQAMSPLPHLAQLARDAQVEKQQKKEDLNTCIPHLPALD